MRTIKFRAWDKERKEMYYSDFRVDFNGRIFWWKSEEGYEDWRHDDTVELMQYTGLEDKNGKEIYEGDIVKDEIRRWEVCWEQARGQFMRKALKAKVPLSERQIKMYKVKVIGNVYENPELLNT